MEILETKSPLSTTSRYRKTERGGPWGHKATSGLQGRVEPVATACLAECAAVVGAKRAGVRDIGGEAGGDFNGGGCCGAKRSQPATAARFCWAETIGVEPVEDLACAKARAGVLFAAFEDGTFEPPFFQPRPNDPGRRNMKHKEKDQSPVGYPSGRSEGDKRPCFPRGFVVSTMKKTTRTKPQNDEPTLEAVTTGRARREAQRIGVPLSTYVATLAAKADTMPVMVMLKINDIHRISRIAKGGRVREWIEGIVTDRLECEEGEAQDLAAQN